MPRFPLPTMVRCCCNHGLIPPQNRLQRHTVAAAAGSAPPAFLNPALPEASLGAIDDAEMARKPGARP